MRVFWESTTAQFGLLILSAAALAAGFNLDTDFGWAEWAELGKWILATYAGKESVKYGATAYGGKP